MKIKIFQNNLKGSCSTHRDLRVGIRNVENGARTWEYGIYKNRLSPHASCTERILTPRFIRIRMTWRTEKRTCGNSLMEPHAHMHRMERASPLPINRRCNRPFMYTSKLPFSLFLSLIEFSLSRATSEFPSPKTTLLL